MPAAAQTIIPDSAPSLSTNTVVTVQPDVVSIDGGRVAGPNLFHSFETFNLPSGWTAKWTSSAGATTVTRIINRVTGGTASLLNGTIAVDDSAFPDAEFFFINPAGIVFGRGFELDVPGAVHFATASRINFADGSAYATTPGGRSVFSMDRPASFGFVRDAGEMRIAGASFWTDRAVFAANRLSIDNATLSVGAVRLLAVGAQAADVPISFDRLASVPLTGALLLRNSLVEAASSAPANSPEYAVGVTAGTVRLLGSQITTDEGAITIDIAPDGLLILDEFDERSEISTVSGTIAIADPLAIIFHGGVLAAPREKALSINADFLIDSRDTEDDIDADDVSGIISSFLFHTVYVEGSEVVRLDASNVLRGRCRLSSSDAPSQISQDLYGVRQTIHSPAPPGTAPSSAQLAASGQDPMRSC
jgi:filamentous hemagglutinin family protein